MWFAYIKMIVHSALNITFYSARHGVASSGHSSVSPQLIKLNSFNWKHRHTCVFFTKPVSAVGT